MTKYQGATVELSKMRNILLSPSKSALVKLGAAELRHCWEHILPAEVWQDDFLWYHPAGLRAVLSCSAVCDSLQLYGL